MSNYRKIREFIYRNLVWVLLIISLILLLFPFSNFVLLKEFDPLLNDIGLAVLSSGIFAAVLKSIQFTGLFKEEIEKVILSSEFINKRTDLPELWRKVSNAIYESKFPKISKDLEDIILDSYFPTNAKYYYEDFRITINIEEINSSDIIKLTQTVKVNVIPLDKNQEIDFSTEVTVDKVDGSSNSIALPSIEYYKVNGEDVEYTDSDLDKNDCKKRKFHISLKDEERYLIEKKDRREYSIKDDETKIFRVSSIAKGMNVSINYPKNVRVTFFNIGLIQEFEKMHVEFKNNVSRVHKNGIILPQQGFGISIRRI